MALNIKKKFAADTEKLVSGARLNLGDGAYLLVARWGNKRYQEAFERLRAPHKDKLELGVKLTDEEAEDIYYKALAETILVGWSGLSGFPDQKSEKDIPYSAEMAEALLRDEEMRELRDSVVAFSMNAGNYRKAALAATEKNSAS